MANMTPASKHAPAGGGYRLTMKTGALTGLSATNPLFSLRWTHLSTKMVIQAIDVQLGVTTAYGTAQLTAFSLFFARSFTASDSGGTAFTTTTTLDSALDSNFGQSLLFAGNGDCRISSTGTLTAGTRTLDDQPLTGWIFGTNALAVAPAPSGDSRKQFGTLDATNPITLRQNEGLVITNDILMGATGVVLVYVSIEWQEVPGNVR
jgi:hypothetical protein